MPVTTDTTLHSEDKAEFIDFFAAGLAKRNRDDFLDHFLPRILPDARQRQPLSRGGYGHTGFRRLFTALFAAVPDLHGTVHRWGPTNDGVLVEFTLTGSLGRHPISIDLTDRFVLREGRIASVDTYFDPLPLARHILTHPAQALRLLPRFSPTRTERAAALPDSDYTDHQGGVTDTYSLMAAGRILLAVISLAAPRRPAKLVGIAPAPEIVYLTRIYGARALAIGLGYLTAGPDERHRWQRLSLAVDTIDTLTGLTHLLRRDVPLRAVIAVTALTSSYAALGAAQTVARLRATPCAKPRRPGNSRYPNTERPRYEANSWTMSIYPR